jgi:gamma-glutamylcyclotransferase (GGCT)/AIG2-like uncharacterized protein YtfP
MKAASRSTPPGPSTPSAGSPPPVELLFAYGTLMRGYARHRCLGPRPVPLGEGRVRATLLDLGAYPGLVSGRGAVRGEVYRLESCAVLPAIDREEGYNFERRRTSVTLADGRRVRAWAYWYRGPRARAVPIPGGDYRRRAPSG